MSNRPAEPNTPAPLRRPAGVGAVRRTATRASRTATAMAALLALALGLSALSMGCGPTDPTAQEALGEVLAWMREEPTEATGSAHRWAFAENGTLGRHDAGPSPGLEEALGPFIVQDDTYYFAFADQPGEQWYEFRIDDVNEVWAANDFTRDQKQGLANLLVAMRLVNPLLLLAHWNADNVEVEAGEDEDTWLLTGRLDSPKAADEGLEPAIMEAVRESEFFPGDMDVELLVSDDGRPLEATFDPSDQRPFSFAFSRGDGTPEIPQDTIGIRELLEEGPVGSPAPGSAP